eukprot:TRINITY_DN66617_c4_g14_i1.p1 TRINITY_DN66617_c4_g14~~TRINITY_DN66617_c4_g14_i1.p1  ORF type:complete len:351 (+),score=20.40 TRINITY_DN66617_c4_g14_i1:41-1093(+)
MNVRMRDATVILSLLVALYMFGADHIGAQTASYEPAQPTCSGSGRPQPKTGNTGITVWMFSVSSCDVSPNHITQFVSHYTTHVGIDIRRMQVKLYGPAGQCAAAACLWSDLGVGVVSISKLAFAECTRLTDLMNDLNDLNLGPDDWWFNRDVDEFLVLPPQFKSMTELVQRLGPEVTAVTSHFVDRLASDWRFPEVRLDRSMFDQYPICCKYLTKTLKNVAAPTEKIVVMHSGVVPTTLGCHFPRNSSFIPKDGVCIPELDMLRYPNIKWNGNPMSMQLPRSAIAHFKFTSDVQQVTKRHLATNWRIAYQRMDQNLAKYMTDEGVLNLSEPMLHRADCGLCQAQNWVYNL